MEKKIVIINGSGGVGKDTFVEFCRSYVGVLNISSVNKVKQAAEILGWDGGKTEEDRKFLSDLKLLACAYNNHSYKHIQACIETFKQEDDLNLMFIHLRDIPELDRVAKDFGCITLEVINNNVKKISTNEGDAGVDNYNYDYIIDNSFDLPALRNKAQTFVFKLFNE